MPNRSHLDFTFAPLIHPSYNWHLSGVWVGIQCHTEKEGTLFKRSSLWLHKTLPSTSGASSHQHPAAVASCPISGPERKSWLSLAPFPLQYIDCLSDAFSRTQK